MKISSSKYRLQVRFRNYDQIPSLVIISKYIVNRKMTGEEVIRMTWRSTDNASSTDDPANERDE